jgi:hypothetical protein
MKTDSPSASPNRKHPQGIVPSPPWASPISDRAAKPNGDAPGLQSRVILRQGPHDRSLPWDEGPPVFFALALTCLVCRSWEVVLQELPLPVMVLSGKDRYLGEKAEEG